ncbi:hypothetical protein B0H63DRAFT_529776 [Podospora didyma]|uniref:Uncharacterized protein n=1 Tax=Podospora didyma TaxID=330526 RepID=A0AAE0N0P4_9PEZI|nr:hypothetical protein B0H63DRAFT_529776 [Podospora didyma]
MPGIINWESQTFWAPKAAAAAAATAGPRLASRDLPPTCPAEGSQIVISSDDDELNCLLDDSQPGSPSTAKATTPVTSSSSFGDFRALLASEDADLSAQFAPSKLVCSPQPPFPPALSSQQPSASSTLWAGEDQPALVGCISPRRPHHPATLRSEFTHRAFIRRTKAASDRSVPSHGRSRWLPFAEHAGASLRSIGLPTHPAPSPITRSRLAVAQCVDDDQGSPRRHLHVCLAVALTLTLAIALALALALALTGMTACGRTPTTYGRRTANRTTKMMAGTTQRRTSIPGSTS